MKYRKVGKFESIFMGIGLFDGDNNYILKRELVNVTFYGFRLMKVLGKYRENLEK